MLNRLRDFAQSKELQPEPGYEARKLHWILDLSPDGDPLTLIRQGRQVGKRFEPLVLPSAPALPSNLLRTGEKCHFLAESLPVVLNQASKPGDAEKFNWKHNYFLEMLDKASASESLLGVVASMLRDPNRMARARQIAAAEGAKPTDNLSFSVAGVLLVGLPTWRDWWESFLRSLSSSERGASGWQAIDLLNGQTCKPLATHPPIRGMSAVGGQASSFLISFDKQAFSSFGLEQSQNAALSPGSASTYVDALNHLIQYQSLRIGDMYVLHWFDKAVPEEDDPFALLEAPPEAGEIDALSRSRALFRSIQSGQRPDLANNRYFALGLSGTGARVMTRFWMEGDLGDLAERVEAWFESLAVVEAGFPGRIRSNFRLKLLADTCVPERKSQNASDSVDVAVRRVAGALLQSALTGNPIPSFIAAAALARVRTEICRLDTKSKRDEFRTSHRPERMALLRAFINQPIQPQGGNSMAHVAPSLDPGLPGTAYHCGRLMATLAEVQRKALGDVGAGVVQRYYAAASATPALVFGRLVRGSQFHLAKLDGGLRFYFDRLIGEITQAIGPTMPATLDLEGQTLFALGYYHQLIALRTRKQESANNESDNEQNSPENA